MIDAAAAAGYGATGSTGANPQARSVSDTTAALRGQIQQAQLQLNDWLTCVSATTPKGQAAIRSLSAQISAAKERIARLQTTPSPTTASASASHSPASTAAGAGTGAAAAGTGAAAAAGSLAAGGSRLDVWA